MYWKTKSKHWTMQILHSKVALSVQNNRKRAIHVSLYERLSGKSDIIDVFFPINVPLLIHFFNDSILNEVLATNNQTPYNNTSWTEYKFFEHKSREILDKSKRIEVSLDHFADKTKSNEKIYANLAESIYDGTTYIKSGLSTLDIVTILGICATALNTCFLWIM